MSGQAVVTNEVDAVAVLRRAQVQLDHGHIGSMNLAIEVGAARAVVAELIGAATALQESHDAMLARWWQQHTYEDKVLGNTAGNNTGRMNAALARCGGAA